MVDYINEDFLKYIICQDFSIGISPTESLHDGKFHCIAQYDKRYFLRGVPTMSPDNMYIYTNRDGWYSHTDRGSISCEELLIEIKQTSEESVWAIGIIWRSNLGMNINSKELSKMCTTHHILNTDIIDINNKGYIVNNMSTGTEQINAKIVTMFIQLNDSLCVGG